MAIQGDKIMNLEDGQVLYNDLRRRNERNAGVIEEIINEPSAVQTFDDGADNLPMAMTVAVEPVQDLHGYDNPWPAGGSKNLIPNGTNTNNGFIDETNLLYNGNTGSTSTTKNGYVSEYFPVTAGENYVLSTPVDRNTESVCFYDSNKTFIEGYRFSHNLEVNIVAPVNAVYARCAQTKTLSELIQFEKGTTATTILPYSNICPITGFTGAELTVMGKNLYDKYSAQWVLNKTINNNGEIVDNASYAYNSVYEPIDGGRNITISVTRENSGYGNPIAFYDSNKTFIERKSTIDASSLVTGRVSATIQTPQNARFYRLVSSPLSNITNIMIEYSSVASDYEVYNGITHSIPFSPSAGTVYGGTLTINKDGSGQLVVDRETLTIDQNTSLSKDTSGFYTQVNTFMRSNDYTQNDLLICNCLPSVTNHIILKEIDIGITGYYHATALLSQNWIYFKNGDTSITTVAEMQTWLASNPLQVVYKLATPVSYTLTPGQVKTLLGVNNVWADTGNILSVTYPADTKLYIDKKFAELSAAITALGT